MKGKNDLKSDVDFLSSYVAEVVYEGTAHFPEVKIHEKKNLSEMIMIWSFMCSIDKLLTR